MKLASVSTYIGPNPTPHSGGALSVFVKLETEDGLVGWGETHNSRGFAYLRRQLRKISWQVFEAYLKGRDPMDREALYHKMYEGMMAQHPDAGYGRGQLLTWRCGTSFNGKHFNTPIYNLLGGKYRDRVPLPYVYDNDGPGGTVGTWTGNPERLGMRAAELQMRVSLV